MKQTLNIIAAVGKNTRAIGKKNDLIWKIEGDLPRFKKLTLGHVVIMGKKTWESLPEKTRPLPGRTNIVLSFNNDSFLGATTAHSIDEAIKIAKETNKDIFVIGGGEIFKQTLPLADKLYLTVVESDEPGDIFFPEYENIFKTVISSEPHLDHNPPFTYMELIR